MTTPPPTPTLTPGPRQSVLLALILVAAVANLNLSVANVALPSIGRALEASQVQLNLVAVGYSLGLAASVVYFGALGDRHGRRMMLLIGTAAALPFSVLAAWAPNAEVLFLARLGGGLSAGMAFPTTLALIAALWTGPARTRAIALWSGIGAAVALLGPLVAGWAVTHFWWGSVFLLTVPLAVLALLLAWRLVPAHVNESTDPVDNLSGAVSVVMVGALVLGINLLAVPGRTELALTLFVVAVATGAWFVLRQLRSRFPLYDLRLAARPTFWVAAAAGLVIFGSLMGAMYVGQQFLQNVLDYSGTQAGAAILPAAVLMVLIAPRSALLVERIGSRATLLIGYAFVVLGFVTMLLLWRDGASYDVIGLGYALLGIGVGLSGTPASNALTGSLPPARAGMASATADLQRDLGGAIMQSIFGALLAAGYASSMREAVGAAGAEVAADTEATLERSFAGSESIAASYPAYADQIQVAAREAFLQGDQWAYLAGIGAVLLGAALVFFFFPGRDRERELRTEYQAPPPQR